MNISSLSRFQPYALSLLRIVAGFTFSLHGMQKLFGAWGGMGGKGGTADPFSQLWIAGILECFRGLLVCAGLYTRLIAFVLSGQMAWLISRPMRRAASGRSSAVGNWLSSIASFSFTSSLRVPGPVSLDKAARGKM